MKKFLAMALALLMVCVMLPVVAMADVGDDDVASIGNTGYLTLQRAFVAAQNGDTVKLLKDIDLRLTVAVSNKTVTLDMSGKRLYNTADLWDIPNAAAGNWSLISVRGNGNLTITGNGTFDAKANDCYSVDVQDGATLTIENGIFNGNIHAVYVYQGTANVKGGTYSVQQKFPDAAKADEFVLNCYDDNRANGTAKINVTGGSFKNFNPANNAAEGAGNNFAGNSLVIQAGSGTEDFHVGNAANEVIAAATEGDTILVVNGTSLTNVPTGVIIQNKTANNITVNGNSVTPSEDGNDGYVVPKSTITIIVPSEGGSTTTTPSTDTTKNPSTGANDFVGVAAAAAVMALLGSAVVLRKK